MSVAERRLEHVAVHGRSQVSRAALARSGRLTPRQRDIVTTQSQKVIAGRHPGMRGKAALAAARDHVDRVEKTLRDPQGQA